MPLRLRSGKVYGISAPASQPLLFRPAHILCAPLVTAKLAAALGHYVPWRDYTPWRLRLPRVCRAWRSSLGTSSIRSLELRLDEREMWAEDHIRFNGRNRWSTEIGLRWLDWERHFPNVHRLRLSPVRRQDLDLREFLSTSGEYPSLRSLHIDCYDPALCGRRRAPQTASFVNLRSVHFERFTWEELRLLDWIVEHLPRPERLKRLHLGMLGVDAAALSRFFPEHPRRLPGLRHLCSSEAGEQLMEVLGGTTLAQLSSAILLFTSQASAFPTPMPGLRRLLLEVTRDSEPTLVTPSGPLLNPELRRLRLHLQEHSFACSPKIRAAWPRLECLWLHIDCRWNLGRDAMLVSQLSAALDAFPCLHQLKLQMLGWRWNETPMAFELRLSRVPLELLVLELESVQARLFVSGATERSLREVRWTEASLASLYRGEEEAMPLPISQLNRRFRIYFT